jgi:uncharacterized protein YdcH (DUF465 family)
MITKEKLTHHIKHLEEKHRHLDSQIEVMERVGNYKDEDLHHFKKQRLALRDEIAETVSRLENIA